MLLFLVEQLSFRRQNAITYIYYRQSGSVTFCNETIFCSKKATIFLVNYLKNSNFASDF
jgi:hypothetical protein